MIVDVADLSGMAFPSRSSMRPSQQHQSHRLAQESTAVIVDVADLSGMAFPSRSSMRPSQLNQAIASTPAATKVDAEATELAPDELERILNEAIATGLGEPIHLEEELEREMYVS